MRIAILSGKGGTGKTTVAVNLAAVIPFCQYFDCDVEEPNGHIFLKPIMGSDEPVLVDIPQINPATCSACGSCVEHCQFNALVQVNNTVRVLDKLCHSCGACAIACQQEAITFTGKVIGRLSKGLSPLTVEYYQGLLALGEPIAVPIIKELLRKVKRERPAIIDCPPGIGCTVVKAIEHADFCVLVTEPTAFGLHDLQLAVQMLQAKALPFGVVINKADSDYCQITKYCHQQNLPILARVYLGKAIAQSYAQGKLLIEDHDFKRDFKSLWRRIREEATYAQIGSN